MRLGLQRIAPLCSDARVVASLAFIAAFVLNPAYFAGCSATVGRDFQFDGDDMAKFARAAKSASTVFVNRTTAEKFAWQRGYGAFSVSERDPSAVLAYVRDQRDRHATQRVEPEWEEWNVDDDDDS